MYVESCYNISISKYEKIKKVRLKFPRYPTYLLVFFSIKKNDDTVPNSEKSTSFLKRLVVQNCANGLTI